MLHHLKQMMDMKEEKKVNEFRQFLKSPNEQTEFNNNLVNPEAIYKYWAYTGNLERQRMADPMVHKDMDLAYNIDSFVAFYKK